MLHFAGMGCDERSNLSTAPLCSSYGAHVDIRDPEHNTWRFPADGNCATAVGLIVEDDDGLWKLITGDENQYVSLNTQPRHGSGCAIHPSWDSIKHSLSRELEVDRPLLPPIHANVLM